MLMTDFKNVFLCPLLHTGGFFQYILFLNNIKKCYILVAYQQSNVFASLSHKITLHDSQHRHVEQYYLSCRTSTLSLLNFCFQDQLLIDQQKTSKHVDLKQSILCLHETWLTSFTSTLMYRIFISVTVAT